MTFNNPRMAIWLFLMTTVVLFILLVTTVNLTRQENERLSLQARDNIMWGAAQIETDLQNLTTSLFRYGHSSSGVTKEDLQLRLDLLWSRLNVFRSGEAAQTIMVINDAPNMLDDIVVTLSKLESEILTLNDTDQARAIGLAEDLLALNPQAYGIGIEVFHFLNNETVRSRESLQAGMSHSIQYLIGILVCSLIIGVLWIFETRRANNYSRARDEALAEVQLASQAKSYFLASMSHELRTPLNAIIGFSEVMMGNVFGPIGVKYMDYAKDINQSGQHLLLLINEILDLSKIESRTIDLNFETVQLSQCINDCMTIIRPQAEKEGIIFTGDCLHNSTVEVHADPTRLRQVMINILSNAIKYNKPGGSVEIWCEENHQAGMGRIHIKDTGLGIPEEYKGIIFSPFSRDPRTTREKEGTGIGLSIASLLMESMNGEIGFKSMIGEGTTFWIDIPLVDNSAAACC